MIKLTLQGYVHFYRDELENDWQEQGGNAYMDWNDYLNEKYEEYCEFFAELQQ